MRHWLGWALGALMTLVGSAHFGCGDAERPPPLAAPDPAPSPGGSLVDPEAPEPVLESPCGAATVALEFVRPNLYFTIDASGSMLEAIPAGTPNADVPFPPGDRYGALALAIETLLRRIGHRVKYGARLFPSGDAQCDIGEEVMTLTNGDSVSFAVSGEVGPVLRELMFEIRRRTPRGATPVAQALSGTLGSVQNQAEDTYVFLVTDGAPNCNLTTSCSIDRCIPNIEHALLTEQFVCDDSVNCCEPGLYGPENCLDDAGSLAAVQDLAGQGVRTVVIGIPGSDAYSDLLDELALAGGLPRAGSPSYYRVNDAEELTTTLGALGLEVALSCTIELVEAPPDPTLVNVYFDRQLVPADPVDGWTFIAPQTVQIVGQSCSLMQAGQVLQADIVAGCPVVIQ